MLSRVGIRCHCFTSPVIRRFPASNRIRTFAARASNPTISQSKLNSNNEEEKIEDETISSAELDIATKSSTNEELSSALDPSRSFSLPRHLNGEKIDLTELPCPAPNFHDLRIPPVLYQQLEHANINSPTLIQSAVIPHLMRKPPVNEKENPFYTFPDLLIQEMTGEGKTLAYLLPILSQVTPYLHATQAIIVVPTRELAGQIERVIQQLNKKGKKARGRNPIRVDLCVGEVNPSMCSSLTKPKPVINNSAKSSLPSTPSQSFAENFIDQLPIQPSPVPHIIIGTPRVLHDVLITRSLLDLRSLKYLIFDEIDALLNKPNSQPYIAPLMAMRSELPHLSDNHNNNNKSKALSIIPDLTAQQKELLSFHPRTQIALLSATLTQPVLSFAAVHLSNNRKLLTAASVPDECKRKNRELLIGPSPSSLNKTSRNLSLALTQLAEIPSHISHHFVTLPANIRPKLKNEYLLQLCLAINASYEQKHPNSKKSSLRGSKIIRTDNLTLNGGLNSLPPSRDPYIPQTTAILFNNPYDIFPLLPLFSSGEKKLKLSILSSLSSRTERRDSLSMDPPPDILFCETSLLSRGLDLKSLTHIINWNIPATSIDYIHRAGRVGRKGSINSHEGSVITMITEGSGDEEKVAKLIRGAGGNWLSQLVVRGEKLFSRHKHSWRTINKTNQAKGDDNDEPNENNSPVETLNEPADAPSFISQLVDPDAMKFSTRRSESKGSQSKKFASSRVA